MGQSSRTREADMIVNLLVAIWLVLHPTHQRTPVAPYVAPGREPMREGYFVMGAPSISLSRFCGVLEHYRSPAASQCAIFYNQGVAAGVDPVMWLAFSKMENEFFIDGGSSLPNKNMGNLRCGRSYCRYVSFAAGSAAWYSLIRKYALLWHRPTVDTIVPMYAPASDGNNVSWYIATVKRLVDRWHVEEAQP
jgi:hypothetical protein